MMHFRIYNPEVPPFTITESNVSVETKFNSTEAAITKKIQTQELHLTLRAYSEINVIQRSVEVTNLT